MIMTLVFKRLKSLLDLDLLGNYYMLLLLSAMYISMRGVAIFAKDFSGLLLEKSAKTTRPPMPAAAPIRPASLAIHPTRGAQLSFAMTLRHFVKPAFSLRKKTLRENTCTMAIGD
jgi:hypothetical protein